MDKYEKYKRSEPKSGISVESCFLRIQYLASTNRRDGHTLAAVAAGADAPVAFLDEAGFFAAGLDADLVLAFEAGLALVVVDLGFAVADLGLAAPGLGLALVAVFGLALSAAACCSG